MESLLTEQVEETQLSLGVAGHLHQLLRREVAANLLETPSQRFRILFQRNHLERSVKQEEEGDGFNDANEIIVNRLPALRWK